MRCFAIQAICHEKSLWKIMRMLEENQCRGLMARPVSNGKDDEPKLTSNGTNRKVSKISTLLQIFRKSGEPMELRDVKAAMESAGFNQKFDSALNMLKKRKLIRSTGFATYAITAKGSGEA